MSVAVIEGRRFWNDTPDYDPSWSDRQRERDAANGSTRLLEALLAAQGVKIEVPQFALVSRGRGRPVGQCNRVFKVRCLLPRIRMIQTATANHFGLPVGVITGKNRTREASYPRQIAMYLARHTTGESYPDIAHNFGRRHHTTVMHAVEQIEAKIGTRHRPTIEAINSIREALR